MSSIDALAEACARAALAAGVRVAVAESLTSGAIATTLGKAPEASEWFSGGVVAYDAEVKFAVLGVDRGPVITAKAARQMAEGLLHLMPVEAVVAVTGAGGPGPEEGEPAGTVFIAHARVGHPDAPPRAAVDEHRFDGDPSEVVHQTVEAALHALLAELEAPA
ncbi:CinA family protein [Agromyces larvae]|uniref:CinA family protein n=1 Tax=Agromyces larvae TaxID=2929802 RepID=A0ABY4BVU4_9MICO|nr:nicotinamide-nucleotide amidohydrolase family protein [Agromyces larvae]UOE43294.1 CinA family protein [Agromyces larvae]